MEREIVKEKIYKILDSMGYDTDSTDERVKYYIDMGMDSLDSVEYLVEIEKEFGISITDQNMEEMYHSSLCATIDMIHETVNKKE